MASEIISFILFLSSIFLYVTRASASRVWFSLVLFFLGLYVILNVILIGSNYFTGEGITDAVLYTVTSSLKGAGLNKYILPFIGLLTGLIAVFALLAWGLKQRRAKNSSVMYSVLAVVLAVVLSRFNSGIPEYLPPGENADLRSWRRFRYLLQSAGKNR